MTDQKRAAPDWEAIERHYRAGIMSLREIATTVGNVTEGAIRKRAKKDMWTRNLAERIQQKAEELVRKEAVRTPSTQLTPASEREVVEANAEIQYRVRMEHRQDIAALRSLFGTMLGELKMVSAPEGAVVLEQLYELLHADEADPDDKDGSKRADAMRRALNRALDLGDRVDTAKKLTEMLEKVIRMEREAFGIKPDEAAVNEVDDLLKRLGRGEL